MRYVNTTLIALELEPLKDYCLEMAPLIANKWKQHIGVGNKSLFDDISLTTKLHFYYNFLLFPNKQLHSLYFEIQKFFKTIKDSDKPHYITMWYNIHYKNENLDWHSHNPPEHNAYHGYFAVDAEPSITTYRLSDGSIEQVVNKNNQIVLSKSDGDQHCVSIWQEDRPRITLAFDIIPCNIANGSLRVENRTNNWMPI